MATLRLRAFDCKPCSSFWLFEYQATSAGKAEIKTPAPHFPNTHQLSGLRFTFSCCWQNRIRPAVRPEILGCINASESTCHYASDTEEIKTADALVCKDELICPRNGMRATDLIKSTVRSSRKINPSHWLSPTPCQNTRARAACQFAAAGKDGIHEESHTRLETTPAPASAVLLHQTNSSDCSTFALNLRKKGESSPFSKAQRKNGLLEKLGN